MRALGFETLSMQKKNGVKEGQRVFSKSSSCDGTSWFQICYMIRVFGLDDILNSGIAVKKKRQTRLWEMRIITW